MEGRPRWGTRRTGYAERRILHPDATQRPAPARAPLSAGDVHLDLRGCLRPGLAPTRVGRRFFDCVDTGLEVPLPSQTLRFWVPPYSQRPLLIPAGQTESLSSQPGLLEGVCTAGLYPISGA